MDHHFNTKIAELYGVNEAIIINNMAFWTMKNKANNKHFYDDRFWTYNSVSAFTKLFPYWSEKQIIRILKSLEEKGIVTVGNYNKAAYDRTKWYSLEPLILDICLYGQMDLPKRSDANDQMGTPIPYNKQDNKRDIKETSMVAAVLEYYDTVTNIPKYKTVTEARKKAINSRVKDHGIDTVKEVIRQASESNFLSGSLNTTWYNFDWLFNPNNFVKILEGKYSDKSNSSYKSDDDMLKPKGFDDWDFDKKLDWINNNGGIGRF